MLDQTIHKLIVPGPKQGRLKELILCWPLQQNIINSIVENRHFSADINEVTCSACWQYWRQGVYTIYTQEEN